MRTPFSICLAVILLVATSASAAGQRTLRRVEHSPVNPSPLPQPMWEDQLYDTLRYDYPDVSENCFPLPSWDASDRYYNVRFTPTFWPFRLVEAQVKLDRQGGLGGRPDMKVIVWRSGEFEGETGFPTEPIDSLIVPFDSLVFDPTGVRLTRVNLRSLNITRYWLRDFHVGIDVISDDGRDSLYLCIDEGHEGDQEGRSVIWNPDEELWLRMKDLFVGISYNFGIRVVITDDSLHAPTVLEPDGAPASICLLDPACPNPFNDFTRIPFTVRSGVPYTIALFDGYGREISALAAGTGQGRGELLLAGRGLTAGVYWLGLYAGRRTSWQKLVYLK